MQIYLMRALLAAMCALPFAANAAENETQRQADVARLGAEVMPFSLKSTTHVFTKTPDGGVQRVVARNAGDARQVELVRAHLQEIQAQFQKGDFSAPEHIHGVEMPGLAELRAARPGEVSIGYRPLKDGAELTYRTADARLAEALHVWFDAQLSDHGADAMQGHQHEHHHADMPHR